MRIPLQKTGFHQHISTDKFSKVIWLAFILKWVYAKKIKDFEFNRGSKTTTAPGLYGFNKDE